MHKHSLHWKGRWPRGADFSLITGSPFSMPSYILDDNFLFFSLTVTLCHQCTRILMLRGLRGFIIWVCRHSIGQHAQSEKKWVVLWHCHSYVRYKYGTTSWLVLVLRPGIVTSDKRESLERKCSKIIDCLLKELKRNILQGISQDNAMQCHWELALSFFLFFVGNGLQYALLVSRTLLCGCVAS
jgi:hypothetical protein